MDNEHLCLSLAKAKTEKEIIKLLRDEGYWDDPDCWKFYGGIENNFSTIGNQQSAPEAALVEKIVNSVDAMFIKECLLKGINPESDDAPQSIEDAMKSFFNIRGGSLSNINALTRGKLAENICLVATGSKTNPCYSIIDKGEGQTPNNMPKTFLSLQERSNKLRIPFVQGKFNMGGTGALLFCGKHNLQLVISKRHPDLAKTECDETANLWGFTIVRREDPSEGRRSSTYRYLAPKDKILSFDADSLPLLPGKYPNAFEKPLEWGTYMRLYEYQMKGLKSVLLFHPYNRLSILLPNIALPVRSYERRRGYRGVNMEATMSGLGVRLEEDKRGNIESGFPSSSSISVLGEEMACSIYAFKKDKHKTYTKNEGIIFTVNGQTHGYITKNFFKRRSVGTSSLADSILVIMDCNNLSGRSREDLFMNSRDRLRKGELKSEIENNLEEIIKKHLGLRELRERRKREEIETKLEDDKPLADVLNDIIKKSPTLTSILISGKKIHDPFNLMKVGSAKKPFECERFPTYFRLMKKYKKPLNCPINKKFTIKYETDVENDYFKRDELPGKFELKVNGGSVTDKSLNLWNGIANLIVELPQEINVGDTLTYESIVSDDRMVNPFVENFKISIDKEIEIKQRQQKLFSDEKKEKTPLEEEGKDRELPSKLGLPDIREIRRDKWESHNFDKFSALRIDGGDEEGFTFWVNIDNIYLLNEIKSKINSDSRLLEARYMYSLVLIGLALLKQDSEAKKEEKDDEEIPIFDKIGDFTKAISPVILPMISSLGELERSEG